MIDPNTLTPYQREQHLRLQVDLPFFAETVLIVKTKQGTLEPYRFNAAQWYLHNEAERMLAETGKVRIIIVKGRQQGCSTYVTARFYHKVTWNRAKSVFILSHEGTSTENLFQKVEEYNERSPEMVRPKIITGNRRQLKFENGSEYRVGTAGAGSTGRSQTNQFFHGSEVAFYTNSDEVNSGVLQTVASLPGTEVFLESTANGVAGIGAFFYGKAMDALQGIGEYRLVFIPWYWQEEYREKVPANVYFSPEELQVCEMYGLDKEQLYWRQLKIIELGESLFKQEYPFTVKEAFQSSGDSLISPLNVQQARKSKTTDTVAPLIMGVDAAKSGDRTVILFRRGRQVIQYYSYRDMEEMRLAGIVADFIDRLSVAKAFIDVGSAYGTIDRLKELGYGDIVTPVNFSTTPIRNDVYLNKRAEIAGEARDWFTEPGVSIPDDEDFEADLLSVPGFKVTSSGKMQLVSKDEIRKTFGKSPDIFDAFCLTFSFPVRTAEATTRLPKRTDLSKNGSPFQTLRRMREMNKNPDAVQFNLWTRPND